MKVYIASSWKNQHAVELLTAKLREYDIQVLSFVENSFGEGYDIECADMGFEAWVKTENAEKAFVYDTQGAMQCDAFIYLGPSGKDAAAEVGMCYGQRLAGRTIPMYALYAKGEDFGLMRKVFDAWFSRWQDLVMALANGKVQRSCRQCGCTDNDCRQCIEAQGHPCSWVDVDLCSRCYKDNIKS